MSMADRDGFIWKDGKLVDWRDATVHVLTRTLHDGMGVSEGVRAYQQQDGSTAMFRLEDHTKRLLNSANTVSMLVNQEAVDDGYVEAMLLDPEGDVCQGSGENVFMALDAELYAPDLSGGALDGITRRTIMTLADEFGIPCTGKRMSRDEFYIADEAFFNGTAAEVSRSGNSTAGRSVTAHVARSPRGCRRRSSTSSTGAVRRTRPGGRSSEDKS